MLPCGQAHNRLSSYMDRTHIPGYATSLFPYASIMSSPTWLLRSYRHHRLQSVQLGLSTFEVPSASYRCLVCHNSGNGNPTPSSQLPDVLKPSLGSAKCPKCGGKGSVRCKDCEGTGRLKRGGYNKKNPIPKQIINSKWTAMVETLGWRHFRILQQRKQAGMVFVHMQASCDASAQLWVNLETLRDRKRWAAGWLQMSEVVDPQQTLNAGQPCRGCSGTGVMPCSACDASGVAVINL